jgi:hypothetical protein
MKMETPGSFFMVYDKAEYIILYMRQSLGYFCTTMVKVFIAMTLDDHVSIAAAGYLKGYIKSHFFRNKTRYHRRTNQDDS